MGPREVLFLCLSFLKKGNSILMAREQDSRLQPRDIAPLEQREFAPEIFARFKDAPVKIALQKDGGLTEVARNVVLQRFGQEVPTKPPYKRVPLAVSEDGEFGYLYAKNKALCGLVASGAVDMAVVGTDRIIEESAEKHVQIAEIFKEFSWPIVLATPPHSRIEKLSQIRRLATQYPRITELALASMGQDEVEILTTHGGTETYAYLQYFGEAIDGVVDIVESGATLRAHGLRPWEPKLCEIYPTVIVNKESPLATQLGNALTATNGLVSGEVVFHA